jgi:sporulation protein YlmC with PRC-barrel domain
MNTRLALALAGATLIALPAAAQTTATPDTTTKAQADKAPAMYEMKPGQWRATKLTGVAVYNNNNERIGDVNELIVARDGKTEAVVIGVGGFLGMGEHLVAVPFDKVKWMDQPREQTVTTRTTTTTTGSGTSTDPASPPTPSTADRTTTTTTAADRPVTTNTTDRPAAMPTTDRPATTTTAANTRANDAYRGYPDHAVVDMTKDQLKALPEVRYAR